MIVWTPAKKAQFHQGHPVLVSAEQMGEWAAKMHVSTQLDYYYGRARHSGNATWGTNRTFAFDTINVDVDCHNGCTDMPSGQGGGG